MCLCIGFGMHVFFCCIFQHLPTTPPHPLNPTNPTTTTKPQQLTHPALPSIYNNNHTISGGVPPPSPTHPPIFLLFNCYARNHILPPTYMLPLWWLAFLNVVWFSWMVCVISFNCLFFMMFSKHMFSYMFLHVFWHFSVTVMCFGTCFEYVWLCMLLYMHTLHIYIYIYMYVFMYIYICIYIYIYTYINIHIQQPSLIVAKSLISHLA